MADKTISQLTGATTPLAGTEEVPLVQSSTTKKATVANLTAGRAVSMDSLGLGGTAPVAYAAIEWGPSAAVTYGVELTPLLNANTTNVQMFRARPRATANTHTDVTAYYAGLDGLASASTTTTAYGLRVTSPTGGVTNLYGVHSAITSGAGRYHIYLSTDADSYTAGNWQFASGKGIDFSATAGTGTSELFDDYEEGEWTPVFSDAASGGNVSPSQAALVGRYTKIGNLVVCRFRVLNINTTGMTAGNDFFIQGFPFLSEGTTYNDNVGVVATERITFTGSVALELPRNETYARLLEYSSNADDDYIIVSELASNLADIIATISYTVA